MWQNVQCKRSTARFVLQLAGSTLIEKLNYHKMEIISFKNASLWWSRVPEASCWFRANRNILNKISDLYEDLFSINYHTAHASDFREQLSGIKKQSIRRQQIRKNRMLADVSKKLFETRFLTLNLSTLGRSFRKPVKNNILYCYALGLVHDSCRQIYHSGWNTGLIKERCCNYIDTLDENMILERLQKLSD